MVGTQGPPRQTHINCTDGMASAAAVICLTSSCGLWSGLGRMSCRVLVGMPASYSDWWKREGKGGDAISGSSFISVDHRSPGKPFWNNGDTGDTGFGQEVAAQTMRRGSVVPASQRCVGTRCPRHRCLRCGVCQALLEVGPGHTSEGRSAASEVKQTRSVYAMLILLELLVPGSEAWSQTLDLKYRRQHWDAHQFFSG